MHVIQPLADKKERRELIELFSSGLLELVTIPPSPSTLKTNVTSGSISSFANTLKMNEQLVLLAKIENKIIGFFVFVKKHDEQPFSFIRYVYVLPKFRKQGICTDFIEYIEKHYSLTADAVLCESDKFKLWKERGFIYFLLGLNEEIIDNFNRSGILTCFLSKTDMSDTGKPLLELDFLELNGMNPYHLNRFSRTNVMDFFKEYERLQNNIV